MINVTLRFSESLLSILRDVNHPGSEAGEIRVETGATVRRLLRSLSINPLLVPMIVQDTRRIDVDTPLDRDCVLTLHGPLAGG